MQKSKVNHKKVGILLNFRDFQRNEQIILEFLSSIGYFQYYPIVPDAAKVPFSVQSEMFSMIKPDKSL
jgi:hypothetical protein